MKAGAAPADITDAVKNSLSRYRRVRPVRVPPRDELLYSEVMSTWRYDRRFLDNEGEPKALPREGDISFESLVATAVSGADATHVLMLLARLKAISQDRNGYVR